MFFLSEVDTVYVSRVGASDIKLPTCGSSDVIGCEVVSGKPALTHVLNEIARTMVQEHRQFFIVLAICSGEQYSVHSLLQSLYIFLLVYT